MSASYERSLGGVPSLPTRRSRAVSALPVLAASFALVAVVAAADYLTGYDIRLAILYLVPIALATWKVGGLAGAFVAVASSLCWLVAFESAHPYLHPFYFYWEGVLNAIIYLLIVVLLTRLRIALERSDERFVTVLEGLETAVGVEDARSGALLYANRRWRESFGAALPSFRDAGETWYEPTGRWYLVQPRPLLWVDGRAALLRVWSDVTEARRARELIERHRDAAHRAARLVALGEFASAIAHELNQPLAAIATYNDSCLRLLQSGAAQGPEVRAAMEKCRDQAKRAGAIIQRLREVLRQRQPVRTEEDLAEVARAALRLAESEALEAGVSLELAVADKLRVRGDRLLLEQVVLNLLRNAIEAVEGLPAERRRVRVEAAADADGRQTLAVSDEGDGVAPEISSRLFEAFVTTRAGGLGLGLSICRSVIEAHDGAIGYAPGGARGARFAFSLPASGS
jgi:C4-dicarboxylate-specific signal transduction histidine kinase